MNKYVSIFILSLLVCSQGYAMPKSGDEQPATDQKDAVNKGLIKKPRKTSSDSDEPRHSESEKDAAESPVQKAKKRHRKAKRKEGSHERSFDSYSSDSNPVELVGMKRKKVGETQENQVAPSRGDGGEYAQLLIEHEKLKDEVAGLKTALERVKDLFLTKKEVDKLYYNVKEINSLYYTKREAKKEFFTKDEVKNLFYTSKKINAKFAPKEDLKETDSLLATVCLEGAIHDYQLSLRNDGKVFQKFNERLAEFKKIDKIKNGEKKVNGLSVVMNKAVGQDEWTDKTKKSITKDAKKLLREHRAKVVEEMETRSAKRAARNNP